MERQSGMTLVEVLTVLAVMGFGIGATALYLRPAEAPLVTAVALTQASLQNSRLKAMASRNAYRIRPGGDRLLAESGPRCSTSLWTHDPDASIEFPTGVSVNSGWDVCFSPRGIASNNVTITLSHSHYGSSQVEVLLGGTTREIP